MPTRIYHGDFTFDDEKINDIAKNIEVVNRKKVVLGQFFSPNAAINGDMLTKRRQVLIDPVAVANLNEGQTPRKDSIKLVTWAQKTRSFGSYIEYSRQAFKKNRDSIVEMARRQLAHNRKFDIEATRFAALNTATYDVDAVYDGTAAKFDWWKTFTNAKIKASKNKGTGKVYFMATPEIIGSIMEEIKNSNPNLLTGSGAGPDFLQNGYIGEYNGVVLVENAEPYMYTAATAASGTEGQEGYVPAVPAKHLAFFIVHTEDGMWPLVENRLGEGNIEVISKEIGSAGTADPTNEVGTIASRIDDVGAYLENPQCVYAVRNITQSMIAKVNSALPDAYKLTSVFETISGSAVGDKTHGYGQGAGLNNADKQVVSPAE